MDKITAGVECVIPFSGINAAAAFNVSHMSAGKTGLCWVNAGVVSCAPCIKNTCVNPLNGTLNNTGFNQVAVGQNNFGVGIKTDGTIHFLMNE